MHYMGQHKSGMPVRQTTATEFARREIMARHWQQQRMARALENGAIFQADEIDQEGN